MYKLLPHQIIVYCSFIYIIFLIILRSTCHHSFGNAHLVVSDLFLFYQIFVYILFIVHNVN